VVVLCVYLLGGAGVSPRTHAHTHTFSHMYTHTRAHISIYIDRYREMHIDPPVQGHKGRRREEFPHRQRVEEGAGVLVSLL
jgi:hypothetical protein